MKKRKVKCSRKMLFRIAMQGKAVTKVLTVFLCAFSFALFALASTGFAYSREAMLVRAYSYLVENSYPFIAFECDEVAASGASRYVLGEERIARIHERLGDNFAYAYDPLAHPAVLIDYDRFLYDEQDPMQPLTRGNVLSGDEELLEALGYRLLEGRFAESAAEVVVPESAFESFVKYGYRDASVNYFQIINGNFADGTPYLDPETGRPFVEGLYLPANYTGYIYRDGDGGERERIETYSDLIGKKLLLRGDLTHGGVEEDVFEENLAGSIEGDVYACTIVGIASSDGIPEAQRSGFTPREHFLFSEAWHETLFPDGDGLCTRLYAPATADSAYLRGCVELTLEFTQASEGAYVGAHDIYALAESEGFSGETLIIVIGGAAGVFFGIFAVLLCRYLTASSLALKERKIGILRSLGAGEGDVKCIVLYEALFVAVCSFLLALALSLIGYYGVLEGLFFIADYGVSKLVFNGWNVLILAVLSFFVPLLSSLPPLRKFLKRPIVDNITGNAGR